MAVPGEFGGDPPAMRALGNKLHDVASRLDKMSQLLGSELANVEWRGQDADRYRNRWVNEFVPALVRIRIDLGTAAGHIHGDATTQERASSAGGGGW